MYQCDLVKFPFSSGSMNLFSPYLMDDETRPDTPLLIDGKIVLFRTQSGAISFMEKHFPGVSFCESTPFEFEIKTFIEDIKAGEQCGAVIDNLNIMFDYLKELKITRYPFFPGNLIFDFADYATFHKEIGVFFQRCPRLTPSKLIDFLYWFLGEISRHSILLFETRVQRDCRWRQRPRERNPRRGHDSGQAVAGTHVKERFRVPATACPES